ncbi:hypothetical protein BCR33DRAFT_739249 [Rhizoclosmatium globosum]|uniref:Uncharacterized protein n=1 Tax=Rhizoclosmatium globosum TaxID=329046 RepID=A0A1Y2C5R5_9FUNG|nr:hypothetical protein BCR33DRAFT_739249 [Rhizoclosmatium globosum]|eukprot:ORY42217.1 hypothetical protein BCR33DRAFT_739249 [Rhizoclosmatium globosum]
MPATTDTANPANITSEQIAHFLASAGDGKPKTAADVAFAVAAFEARHVLVAAREASFALFGLGAGVFCDGGAAFLRRVLAKASKPALSQLNPPQKLAPNAVVEARIKDAKRLKTIQKSLADDLRHVLLLFTEKTKLRPTIDQDTSLAAEICLLITALDLNSVDSHVLALADTILSSCLNTYKSHNNQKKAFQLYLSKLLDPTLSFRQFLMRERVSLERNDATSKALISSINTTIHTLLDTSLFHKEHMPEYVAALQIVVAPPKSASTALSSQCSGIIHTLKSKDSAKASYPKLLFDRLLELSKDGPQEHVITMFPHLLASFIVSRKRHAKLQDSNLVFSVDFASFLTLLSILVHSTAAASKDFTDSVKNLMLLDSQWSSLGSLSSSVIGNLVRVLVEHDVYKATQDNVSKQQLSAFKDLNSVLVQIVGGLSGSDRGVVFDVLGALMQIDHSVVVDSIDALWIYLVVMIEVSHSHQQPDTKSRASALQFTLLLLQTLTQSRELESFFTQCFNALSEFSQSDLTGSILLEDAFLKALSTAVSKTLPAQLPHLLTFLTHQFFSTPEEDDEPAQKRRATEAPTTSPQILSPFLSQSKSSLHSCTSSEIWYPKSRKRRSPPRAIRRRSRRTLPIRHRPHNPIPTTPTTSKRPRQDPSLAQEHGFTLLLALMQSSEDFWKRNVSTEFIISVVGASLSDSDLITLMKVRVSLFHAECVASNSLDPRMEGETASLVTMALERVQTVMARGKGKGDGVGMGV